MQRDCSSKSDIFLSFTMERIFMAAFNIKQVLQLLLIIYSWRFANGQTSCIFGDAPECFFPCGCELQTSSSTAACDPMTGHCFSDNCIDGYTLTDIGTHRICEKHSYSTHDTPVDIFLVNPFTKKRLTGNLFENEHVFPINADYRDCGPLLSSPPLDFNGTYAWEFDFEHKFEFYHINISLWDTCNYIGCGHVQVEISNNMDEIHEIDVCRMDTRNGFNLVCDNVTPFIADRMFVTFPNTRWKCVSINDINLYDVRRKLNIDCSKCEQQYEAESCGNGLWCERCMEGWRAPDCMRPCEPGFYGINCAQSYSLDWSGSFYVGASNDYVHIGFECDVDISYHVQKDIDFEVRYRCNVIFLPL